MNMNGLYKKYIFLVSFLCAFSVVSRPMTRSIAYAEQLVFVVQQVAKIMTLIQALELVKTKEVVEVRYSAKDLLNQADVAQKVHDMIREAHFQAEKEGKAVAIIVTDMDALMDASVFSEVPEALKIFYRELEKFSRHDVYDDAFFLLTSEKDPASTNWYLPQGRHARSFLEPDQNRIRKVMRTTSDRYAYRWEKIKQKQQEEERRNQEQQVVVPQDGGEDKGKEVVLPKKEEPVSAPVAPEQGQKQEGSDTQPQNHIQKEYKECQQQKDALLQCLREQEANVHVQRKRLEDQRAEFQGRLREVETTKHDLAREVQYNKELRSENSDLKNDKSALETTVFQLQAAVALCVAVLAIRPIRWLMNKLSGHKKVDAAAVSKNKKKRRASILKTLPNPA